MCVCVCIADEFVSKRVLMDGCLAVQRLLGGRLSRCLPSFLPSFLPGLLILIYLALRRWEAFAFFFFFLLPLVYHKKISQSHAHLKSSTIQGRVGGMEIGRIL